MNEQEIEAVAQKLAEILERRFNERQNEMAAKVVKLFLYTPLKIKTCEDLPTTTSL